ncbi:bifunctional diguanylate cyclase/phosphodiesterase [Armatimonas rosea]|uniref:Diguanylate cyclase (GGDEF)-like protein n=1 Tax=Armatimonas rosea TaxID=685828 RepID=A0A7W9W8X3_ARMRO|nr:EAL domain-containing protein [Armatimonas rosea]MBB6052590.1 diguanylate cyclase (GGDEF)-like protein [Armatimonas rosea]
MQNRSPLLETTRDDDERQDRLQARLLMTLRAFAFKANAAGLTFPCEATAQALLPLSSTNSYAERLEESIHRQDRAYRSATWTQAIEKQQPLVSNTFRVCDQWGKWHWLHEEAHVLYQPDGWDAVGTFVDVTRQERNAALHVGQTRILKMIAEHRPLATILDSLNLLIEELVPESLTCILGYAPLTNSVYDLSAPNLPQGYRTAINGLIVSPDAGSCGAALSRKKPVVVKDIATDPLWKDFVTLAVDGYGLRSCWSHPILTNEGNPVGTFAIYHRHPHTPTGWERELLATAAYLAGVAIERSESENTIRYQASHDSLTGLPNRHRFTTDVTAQLDAARQQQTTLTLLFLDLDRFKQVNDSLGHSFGDHLLQTIASRMQDVVGERVYRMGGDEFTILLENSDARQTDELVKRLRRELSRLVQLDNYEYLPSVTIGISDYPGHAENAHSLLKYADIALHRAKEDHYGGTRRFDPILAQNLAQKVQLESDLRQAVEQQAFTLHYQVKVDARTHQPIGVEALIRWQHPERGMVSPGEFIPLAEETGLILPLGDWVMQTACQQARAWEIAGLPLRVSINVSARQLLQPDLQKRVQSALQQSGVRPDLIGFELTETAILKHGKSAERTLNALKDLGIWLELDDFGTGFSSLVSLRNYRIDVLKIDRLFVHNLKRTSNDAAIVRGVIEMGHALNMTVVAEGVETRAQAELLTELGCDGLQGFYFARPVPVEQLCLDHAPRLRRAA